MSLQQRRSYAPRKNNASWLAHMFCRRPIAAPPRHRLTLERCEQRIAPATAVLSSGVLTIDFTATGSTSESVTVARSSATSITVTGVVGSPVNFPIGSVTSIVGTDSGGSDNQVLTIQGPSSPINLSGGLSVTGVESVLIDVSINGTAAGAISITAPKTIEIGFGINLTTVSGNINLNANQQATPTTGSFYGIRCQWSIISSTSGSIALNGRSGDTQNAVGVFLGGKSAVSTGATGDITINGTASGSGDFVEGVEIGYNSATSITTGGGNISILGQVLNATGSASQVVWGVLAGGTSKVSAGGDGNVTIEGIASPSAGNGLAIVVSLSASIATAGGNLTLIGKSELDLEAVAISGGATISTGKTAPIKIIADTLRIDSTAKVQAGALSNSTVTIAPRTAGTKINLGGADDFSGSPQTLGLTSAELNRISAGTVIIGSNGSGPYPGVATGPITLSADIVRLSKIGVSLATSSSISLDAKLDSMGGDIALNAAGAITQSAGTIQAGAGVLALNAPNQTATFNSLGNKAAQLVIPATVTAIVNGSFDSTGFVQVDGTLGGTGSVGVTTVSSTGRIKPGSGGPGKLTTGNIVFNSGSVFDVQLNGASYSQLAVNGTVNLGGATLQATTTPPNTGEVYRIIDNLGAGDVTGTFAGLSEGTTTTIGTTSYVVRV